MDIKNQFILEPKFFLKASNKFEKDRKIINNNND